MSRYALNIQEVSLYGVPSAIFQLCRRGSGPMENGQEFEPINPTMPLNA